MITQRRLFRKGEDLWTFIAVAKQEDESQGRDLMRKLKARSLHQVLSDKEESGMQPHLSLRLLSSQVCLPQFMCQYSTHESKNGAGKSSLHSFHMLNDSYQEISASPAAVLGTGLDLHACRLGFPAYRSVSASPGTGNEARGPATQSPESSG